MRSVHFGARSIPVAFAAVTLLAYGLLVPWTGFYWDDWPFAWIARFLGPSEFIPAFRGFRPFLGPIFFVTTSLIPPNPLSWQIFALFIRFAAAVAAWFALLQVWPRFRQQVLAVTMLFLTFPGYSQHWVAFTHINQEWISFICYLLSIGLSVVAIRRPKRYLAATLGALLLLVVGLFPTEYFIGLEPLRFLLIWVVVAESTSGFGPRLARTLRIWWPYLLLWLVDVVWLFYYYRSGAYISYDLTAASVAPPLNQAFLLFGEALWKAGLYVWIQVLVLVAQSLTAPSSLFTIALIILAFMLSSLYLFGLLLPRRSPPSATSPRGTSAAEPVETDPRTFALPAVIIGVTGVLLGRVPSFAAGLPLTLQSSFDRFMISMMLGASLLIVGLVEMLLRSVRAKTYVIAGLLALGVGQQFFNANIFRRDWQRQQEIYWQMAWRIPALEPGTAIVTQQMPLDYETDLSMTAALNWIYSGESHPAGLPYALVYSEKRLGGAVLPNLSPGTPMQMPFRTVEFSGTTSRVVIIYVPPDGCLRVLDAAYGDAETYSRFPDSLVAPIPLSDPSLILTAAEPRVPPNPPFDIEPPHTWCYYYERAELARQQQDWTTILALDADATRMGYGPQDPFEWLPFIEAYARGGDAAEAERTTRRLWDDEPKLHRGLCVLWGRIGEDGPEGARKVAARLIGEFSCGH